MRSICIGAVLMALAACATTPPSAGPGQRAAVTCLPCDVSCVPGTACKPTTQAERDAWENAWAGPAAVAVVAQPRPVAAKPSPPPAVVAKPEPPPPPPAEAPSASPGPGTFAGSQTVTLSSATPGAVIHYTTDGSEPTSASPVYTGPIAVDGTTTIRAVAVAPGAAPSPETSGLYAIAPPPPPAAVTPRVVVTRERLELKEKVYFDTGKATIKPASFGLLDEVAAALQSHDEVKRVEIQGHTDSSGDAAVNKRLSQERAEAVRAYLSGKGVDGARLEAAGFGEEKPIAPNDSAKGREANRRVEFSLEM
jgi:outer membrane protein OmpA-like peptidoglycan-associated protein